MAHKARKRFGQNFLQDHNIINQLLSSLNLSSEQHWVEIGPGLGALTRPLLAENIALDVIELDRDLAKHLRDTFSQSENLTIHQADALSFDFAQVLQSPPQKSHIIGNLPYNISTPLLFHLISFANQIDDMHFMLQKEVVDRICATPGTKKYGRLSVMLQYHCEAENLFDVPPESFNPVPKVMSAIVKLTPHSQPPVTVEDYSDFNTVVTHAFSQRRKTIRNALKKILAEEHFQSLNIDPSLRAEEISLHDYAGLSNILSTIKQ